MKKKLCMLLFCVCLPLGVAGCKSTDYKNAIELEEAKDYSQEAIIYTERDEYKDSKGHLES